jgi:hypothetical protein
MAEALSLEAADGVGHARIAPMPVSAFAAHLKEGWQPSSRYRGEFPLLGSIRRVPPPVADEMLVASQCMRIVVNNLRLGGNHIVGE